MARPLPFLLLSVLVLTTPATSAQSDAAALDSIKAQAERFSAAYVRGDMETLLSIYTDDGMAGPGGRDFVRGRPALDSLWALPTGRTILRHASTPVEIEVDGDHAYDWGYYEGEAAQDGEPLGPFQGKYLIVWERGADGRWRMAADLWNRLPATD